MMIKVGDRLVVQGCFVHPTVIAIQYDQKIECTVIQLDWGVHGYSEVYAHDENKVWHKYSESN